MNSKRKDKRRSWTYNETKTLLNCYLARKDEFSCFRKKKFAYENLVEDLISLNIMESQVTPALVENKMKSLLRAYKSAVDNNKKTGNSPCTEPFATEMEEIFGIGVCAPENISHVVNAGTFPVASESPDISHSVSLTGEVVSTSSSQNTTIIATMSSSGNDVPTIPSTSAPEKKKYRKSLKERMFEKKLSLRKEKKENKVKRWEEKKHIITLHKEKKNKEKRRSTKAKTNLIKELIEFSKNNH